MANGFLQVTIVLRERLEAIGVEVSVETFEEHQGTAGLGEDLFVSCTMVQSVCSNTHSIVMLYALKHMLDHRSNRNTAHI